MTQATRPVRSGQLKSCPVCNEHIQPSRRGVYCSTRCKSRAANRRRQGSPVADKAPQATECQVCGASLVGRKNGTRYCTEPCAQRARWRRARGMEVADSREAKHCAHCGGLVELDPHRKNVRFCSKRCSLNYHCALYASRRRPLLIRRCPVCGDAIPPTDRLTKKYCSVDCRDQRSRSPEVVFRYVNARRARIAGASAHPLPKRVLRRLRSAQCAYCGQAGGTVDHLVPLSRGGQHAEGNLVPACRSCNSSKGDKLLVEWRPIWSGARVSS